MTCKYFVYRSKNYILRPYCRFNRSWVVECTNCQNKSYKSYKPLKKSDKPIKQYSKKRTKEEKERYSIFTNDLTKCIENKEHQGKIDKHEIFNGKNRFKSMKYGLVVGLCRNCHDNEEIIKKWQTIGRQAFIEKYSEEMFIKEFQTRKGSDIDE